MQRRKYALLKQPFELDALGDVSLTSPVLGDVMYYDGSFWINTPYAELVDDRVANLLVAGNNIDITYNDGAGTITIDVETLTSADISDFNEAVDDRISSLIVAGNNIDVTYNDGSNTFTIDVEGLTSADISDFTEAAQDAVGAMASTSGTGVDLVYTDATPALSANLDFSGLTEDTSPDTAADYIATYDASAGTHKKVLLDNLGLTGGGGGGGAVFSGCLTRNSTDQSITGATWTDVNVGSEVYDTDGYYPGSGSKFYAPVTGTYLFTATANFTSAGDMGLFIAKNAAPSAGTQLASAYGTDMFRNTLAWSGELAAGDYLHLQALTSAGNTLDNSVQPLEVSMVLLSGSPAFATGTNVTHVDAPPAVPDSMDDEFEGTTLDSKWSWRNQGSATASVADGRLTIGVPSEASANIRGVYQTLPSGNWKFRAKLAYLTRGANYDGFGLVLLENSTNKNLQFVRAYSSAKKWQVHYYTSYTAYSSTPYDSDLSSLDWAWQQDSYFEIEYDGTNYYFRVSPDGINFATLATLAKSSYFTADRIGIAGIQISPSTGTGYLSCEWFRKIGSGYTPGKYAVNAQLEPSTVNIDPDTHPTTANAMDDEFEGTSLDSKWAWRNQGSASLSFAYGSAILGVPSEATAQPRGIYQTLPSGNWKIRAKLSYTGRGANYDGYGLVLLENSTNKNLQFVRAFSSSPRFQVQYYTSYTAYGSTPLDTAATAEYWPFQGWGYFEIEYDGTNYYFRISADGLVFETLATLAKASYFTADRIGLMGLQISPSTGTGYLGCDWFRRVS